MPRFKVAKRRRYTLGKAGVSFFDGETTPHMLRKLADMMEKENPEAYGNATMVIDEPERRRVSIGMLDDGRPLVQLYTKKLHIELDILSPVYVLEEDGTLLEIV